MYFETELACNLFSLWNNSGPLIKISFNFSKLIMIYVSQFMVAIPSLGQGKKDGKENDLSSTLILRVIK
jgi:hypothetical protein